LCASLALECIKQVLLSMNNACATLHVVRAQNNTHLFSSFGEIFTFTFALTNAIVTRYSNIRDPTSLVGASGSAAGAGGACEGAGGPQHANVEIVNVLTARVRQLERDLADARTQIAALHVQHSHKDSLIATLTEQLASTEI